MEEDLEQRVEQLIEEKTVSDEEVDREQLKQEIIEELDSKSEEEKKSLISKVSEGEISRRDFLKTLGLGAGGLALSSSVAAPWSLWQPQNKGTSDINADTVDGKEATDIASVEAVEKDDFSDVSSYTVNDQGGTQTLVNLTGSGKVLGGTVISDTYGGATVDVQITVDGATTQSIPAVQPRNSNNHSWYLVPIPPIRFESSIDITIIPSDPDYTPQCSGYIWVKQ